MAGPADNRVTSGYLKKLLLFPSVREIKPRAPRRLGKYFTTELQPGVKTLFLNNS
jgi:hypothetical protein